MLRWAFISFIFALVSSAIGFGDVATNAVELSIILFFSFPIVAIMSLSGRRLLQAGKTFPLSVPRTPIAVRS